MIKDDIFDIKKNISIVEFCDINAIKKINPLKPFDAIFLYNRKTKIIANDFFLLARMLIEKKIKILFSMGPYAEKIHDLFDEELFEYEYKNNKKINISTIYFDEISKETMEDVFLMSDCDNIVFFILSDTINAQSKADCFFNGIIDKIVINEITVKINALINK